MPNLFRSIIVPHDFSSHATAALKVAAGLVAPRGRLHVLHVLAPYPVTGLTPAEMPYIPPADVAAQLKRQLDAVVRRALPRPGGFRVTTEVVIGDPADRITAAAKGADSVVMATQGRTGLAHLLIGSVAEKVVRHCSRPVLTLRPGTTGRRGPRRGPKRAAR